MIYDEKLEKLKTLIYSIGFNDDESELRYYYISNKKIYNIVIRLEESPDIFNFFLYYSYRTNLTHSIIIDTIYINDFKKELKTEFYRELRKIKIDKILND